MVFVRRTSDQKFPSFSLLPFFERLCSPDDAPSFFINYRKIQGINSNPFQNIPLRGMLADFFIPKLFDEA